MRVLASLVALALLSPSLQAQVIDDVDTKLPKAKAPNPDAVAVVIGNRSYSQKDVPRVEYAIRDAEAIRLYLINSLGFSPENIIFAADAGKATFEGIFGNATDPRGRLADYIKPGRSDVFVFYSGHGAPDAVNNKSYFVPADGDPNYIRLGGYPVEGLYNNLKKLPFRTLTVVIDACFSGFTEQGTLVKEASPALLKVEKAGFDMPNAALFAASAQNQISSWYSDRQHGLFTYYFLKGLQSAAAAGKEQITAGELQSYIESELPAMARRIKGREQVPQFEGDRGRVIATFGKGFAQVPAPAKVDVAAASPDNQSRVTRESSPSVSPSGNPLAGGEPAAAATGGFSKLPAADVHVKRELGRYTLDLRGCANSSVGVLCQFDVTTAQPLPIVEIVVEGFDENGIPAAVDCMSIGTGSGCEAPPARRDMVFQQGYSRFLVRMPSVAPSSTQVKLQVRFKVNTGWRGDNTTRADFDPVPIIR